MNLYFMINDEVVECHMSHLPGLIKEGKINADTLFFDNLVKDKDQFLRSWVKPLKDSWLKRYLN